jgi:hypothetical protein
MVPQNDDPLFTESPDSRVIADHHAELKQELRGVSVLSGDLHTFRIFA